MMRNIFLPGIPAFGLMVILMMLGCRSISAQETYFKFWVQFSDKDHNQYSLENPQEFLSQRSLDRRDKQGIELDISDLPVSQAYLDSISAEDLEILYTSKWLNAAVIQINDSSLAGSLPARPFISSVEYLYRSDLALKSASNKFNETFNMEELPSDNQIEMLQGDKLHEQGFQGQGKMIAVLDGGFENANGIAGLAPLFSQGRIVATRTYVDPDSSFYYPYNGRHGTNVLSVMGGEIPGQFRGSAPKASYILLQTEDVRTEFRIEEANWLAGAEFADSLGADIINSSLGYSIGFTDPVHNYETSQIDGRTALVTRAANLALRKGMIVVTSAGNSGRPADPWKYITAPADGDSVLGIGAVDAFGNRAVFSSRGPSADGRVKPDVMAQGIATSLLFTNGEVGTGNGTSFSSPVMAGMVACLWQSMPQAGNMDIIRAIRESASLNPYPDSLYGYGIPNLALAGWIITGTTLPEPKLQDLLIYPNPAEDYVFVDTEPSGADSYYRIIDLGGRQAASGSLDRGNMIDLSSMPAGTYILSLESKKSHKRCLFIKR